MNRVKFFRNLRISQIVLAIFILIKEEKINNNLSFGSWEFHHYYYHYTYNWDLEIITDIINTYYVDITTFSLISLEYNLFRANLNEPGEYALNVQRFTSQFMTLFNICDDHLDSILLIIWSIVVITDIHTLYENFIDGYHVGNSIFNCILTFLMFLLCIIRMITKYAYQSDDDELYTPLLNKHDAIDVEDNKIDVKLIDDIDAEDNKVNVKLIDDIDVEGNKIDIETLTDVTFVEAVVNENEVDVELIDDDS
ncbi:hypothetical protein C1645_832458 [Glomus cerebriforme]|uniref:Uncharacterized protein n=1 Tax=Glomus cerebriforme TaxID=658196 RepID=A0A397SE82_9GLOM|nr:hypothetical protein C1645_832458 [Glomus cerebriforme]